MGLSERKKMILKAIINDYIKTAEPVGSKSISSRPELNFSSATIRNEMSELEDLGFLEKTHTSSGRIPSTNGYRLYVDELMSMPNIQQSDVNAMNELLKIKVQELDLLISKAGHLISNLTQYATVATMPSFEKMSIRTFEIIRVDPHTFVIVVVTSGGVVKNKLVKMQTNVSEEEAELLTYVLNQTLTNIPLEMITESRFDIVRRAARVTVLFFEVANFVSEIVEEFNDRKYFLQGASRLLNYPEYRDVDKAKALIDCISNEDILFKGDYIINEVEGVKIAIGGSTDKLSPLNDTSMIYATYSIGNLGQGLIGIVGPKRMDYAGVSAKISLFVKGLNKLIKESFDDVIDEKEEDKNGRN